MLRVGDECKYFAEKWMAVTLSIQLKLTPKLSESSVLALSEATNIYDWTLDSCLNDKKKDSAIFINSTEINGIQIVQDIVVRLIIGETDVDPNYLIPTIKKCLNNDWVLNKNGIEHVFKTNIYTYKSAIEDGHSRVEFIMPNNGFNHDFNFVSDIVLDGPYQFIGGNIPPIKLDSDYFYVTKPFLCEQVELRENEVEASYGSLVIKHNGVFLGDNEFTVNLQIGLEHSYLVNVCLEDYLANLNDPNYPNNPNIAVTMVGKLHLRISLGMTLYLVTKYSVRI